MSAQPAGRYLGISEVLAQLRPDFPEVSVSKIRFLETEGLVAPARAPSGYRRFDADDVARLRYILTAQRDQYLPLRVIRERLDAGAAAPAGAAAAQDPPLTRRELAEQAGISEMQLTELETYGLLRRTGRHYGPGALAVARAAAALSGYGVQPRHLRPFQAAVEREVGLIEQTVAPILRQRGAGARAQAAQTATEIAAAAVALHGALIEGAMAEAGLPLVAPLSPRAQAAADARPAASPGVTGATA